MTPRATSTCLQRAPWRRGITLVAAILACAAPGAIVPRAVAQAAPTTRSAPLSPTTRSAPPAPSTRPAPPAPPKPGEPAPPPSLAAPDILGQLAAHPSWLRRLIAAIRLERPEAPSAEARLRALAVDADPRVRSAAILSLTRRGAAPIERLASTEEDPRVMRTLLRCRWPADAERVDRGARALMKSEVPAQRMLGVEIAGALAAQGTATKALVDQAKETLTSIILRLDRETGGALSPRIAAVTGARDSRRDWLWRSWLERHTRTMLIDQGMLAGLGAPAPAADALLALDDAAFARFVGALDELFRKPVDLGVAIDCTASMSGEIAAAQAGIDDLARFINAGTGGLRFALVGYRDKGDDFVTKAWDFTASPDEARTRLWQLWADGGGDEPEMVQEALRLAYGGFGWRPEAQKVLVLIGDAPPIPGFGKSCVEMAGAAHDRGVTTYVLSCRDPKKPDEVKHFPEIARAGGGRVIRLDEQQDLVAEIAGVTLSDTWHDPMIAIYRRYLLLCR